MNNIHNLSFFVHLQFLFKIKKKFPLFIQFFEIKNYYLIGKICKFEKFDMTFNILFIYFFNEGMINYEDNVCLLNMYVKNLEFVCLFPYKKHVYIFRYLYIMWKSVVNFFWAHLIYIIVTMYRIVSIVLSLLVLCST